MPFGFPDSGYRNSGKSDNTVGRAGASPGVDMSTMPTGLGVEGGRLDILACLKYGSVGIEQMGYMNMRETMLDNKRN